jgi:predicted RNA-binding Zn-ribbon protein involved in translation (DUF1610 family)
MQKTITLGGKIVFQCPCSIIEGGPDDTLMDEDYLESNESTLKHVVFIENSAHDPAANVILKDCPSCGLNYLNVLRVGINQVTMYSCECGYNASRDQYVEKK